MPLMKLTLPVLLLLSCLTLPGWLSKPSAVSSAIEGADFVRRADACRALKPFQVSRSDTIETINAAVAQLAAYDAFCGG